MSGIAAFLVLLCVAATLYSYLVYPGLLWVVSRIRDGHALPDEDPPHWPTVSVSLPAYNEEEVIGHTLDRLLASDYPEDRLRIVVISDASTDRTDDIVRSYTDGAVQLLRLADRGGKNAAENAAIDHLEGEIVVNVDATTRILPGSLKALVRTFQDPTVGVASGRDVSLGREDSDDVRGESGYVGYEMWIRELETRVHSIVGASGCLYAIRRHLHDEPVPGGMSRDFTAALRARRAGFRAVSVSEATAGVPRARSLRSEYRRKTRTMLRGLTTLWYHRDLLNPLDWRWFSWMLFSHKVTRWLVPLTLPGALLGLAVLAAGGSGLAWGALGTAGVLAGVTALGLSWPDGRPVPSPLSFGGYVGVSLAAGMASWMKALAQDRQRIWEPTRRATTTGEPQAKSDGS